MSGTLTSTCTVLGQSASQSMAAPSAGESGAAGALDLRIALEDGAQTTWQLPTGDVASDLTLELRYDEIGAPAVSMVPTYGS